MNEWSLLAPERAGDHLSEAEAARLQEKLWALLARRTALYTAAESSSLRVETAEELYASLCFLLRRSLREEKMTREDFLNADAEQFLAHALAQVEQKVTETKRLYQAVCLGISEPENQLRSDTLKSIAGFFTRYRPRYFAHLLPCAIDYPLCCPVAETEEGVDYLHSYLARLFVENEFIRRFPQERVAALLTALSPDYRSLPINLFAPVLANAVALTLLGAEIFPLQIVPSQQAALVAMLAPLGRKELRGALRKAAGALCARFAIRALAAREYLAQAAEELAPRIEGARGTGTLEGIFLA